METNEIQKIKKESQLTEHVEVWQSRVEELKTRCRETPPCDVVELGDLANRQEYLKAKMTALKTTSDETRWSEIANSLDDALSDMEDRDHQVRRVVFQDSI